MSRPRTRLIALVPFKDEMRFLPGFFENVAPQVDGVIALDNGSSDGSAAFVAGQPALLELLEMPVEHRGQFNDGLTHRLLVEASWRHGAEWLIGLDADERLERRFRARAERVIRAANGDLAFYVHWRELWDRPDRWRADGIWGDKRKAILFAARHDHVFDERPVHAVWAPLNGRPKPEPGRTAMGFPTADLIVYHLRMTRPEDRRTRRERYEALDADRRWQPIGYEYLTDTDGLELRRVPRLRGYRPRGR